VQTCDTDFHSADEKDFRSQFNLSRSGNHPFVHQPPTTSKTQVDRYPCFTAAPRHAAAYTLNYFEYYYLMILPCHSEKKEMKNELRKPTNRVTNEWTFLPQIYMMKPNKTLIKDQPCDPRFPQHTHKMTTN
jgi:hypothetical protein